MSTADAKESSIRLWTQDPCGHDSDYGKPGTPDYIRRLVAARHAYAPWMANELGYAATRGLRVLDVGCGQGIDLVEYASEGADAVGVDLTARHVDLARQHLAALGLDGAVTRSDAESLPFADDSFDRVSSNGVLHHTPDMPAALREIRRVTKPGGDAVIIVYNRHSLHYWMDQILLNGLIRRRVLNREGMRGVLSRSVEYSSIGAEVLVRVYTARQLTRLLAEAGFGEVTVVRRHFRPHDTFITAVLANRGLGLLRSDRIQRYLGSRAGWYLVAHAR